MTPERKQYLYDQYFLAITNDGGWYAIVAPKITAGDAGYFLQQTRQIIGAIATERGDTAGPRHRAWLYLQLWDYYNGDIDCLYNASNEPTRELYRRLRPATQAQPGKPTLRISDGLRASLHQELQLTTPSAPEEQPMNTASDTAFVTRHYVYGKDVEAMTQAELISAIQRIEGEVNNLSSVKAKSTKIADTIAELNVMRGQVVTILDSK